MLANPYIPIINADNFDIPLIYDAQEGVATSLSLTKNLISNDISFQDLDYHNKETLNNKDTSSINSYFYDSEDWHLFDAEIISKDFGISLIKELNLSEIFKAMIISSTINNIASSDILFQDLEYYSAKAIDCTMASSFNTLFSVLGNIHFLKYFELATSQIISFSKLLEFFDSSMFDYNYKNIEDLNIIKYFTLAITGITPLSLAKKLNLLSDFTFLNQMALNKSFGLNEHSNFDYIFYSQKTLDSIPIFSFTSSQTLLLSKVLDLSKVFTISGGLQALSISKILNVSNAIQLDYLYYLIDNLTLEETIDVISTFLGVPSKCFTTTIKKMALATTIKKMALDSEILNKCD